jgi:energy-coupling factor transporter ATP-binding protein EcfA2
MTGPWGIIEHHNFMASLTRAFNAANKAEPGDCILLVGATGTGKTSLLSVLLDMLVKRSEPWPDDELHCIHIECDRDAPGGITRNIAVDLNRALGNPFVGLTLPFEGGSGLRIRPSLNEHDLRETFRALCALKRTRYVGIDGVENIVPRQLLSAEARFDSVKSLLKPHQRDVKPHEGVLLLAGHYHLLKYWGVNAQLGRRVLEIPVLPYREEADDIGRFELILESVTPFYPLGPGRSLREWNDVLFRLSAGCIGILHPILKRAEVERLSRRSKHLELKDIIAGAMPRAKLDWIKRDLDGFWGYTESSATPDIIDNAVAREKVRLGETAKKPKPAGKRGRVGQRKVGPRDVVGALS